MGTMAPAAPLPESTFKRYRWPPGRPARCLPGMRRELKRLRGLLPPDAFATVHGLAVAIREETRARERRAAVLAVEVRALRLVASRAAAEVIRRRLDGK